MGFRIKKILAWILHVLRLSDLMLYREHKKYGTQYIRVLNYHDTNGLKIKKHIMWIKKHYQNITYAEFKMFLEGVPLSGIKPGIMLTFDDGLIGNYETTLSVLNEEKMTGYFMVSSDLIGNAGYMSEEQIRELLNQGHMIGCHTATHHRMNKLDTQEILEYEIKESKNKLESMFHIPVEIFCWCGGEEETYTFAAQKMIKEAGYCYGFMTNSFPVFVNTKKLQIQRINVEDTWGISLLKFQICGLMDYKFKAKRQRVNEVTGD